MQVRIRLFAQLRERAGTDELALELPDGARVRDALAAPAVAELAGGLPLVMAVNREYASADAPLAPGDELALIPPVSGGAGDGAEAPAGGSIDVPRAVADNAAAGHVAPAVTGQAADVDEAAAAGHVAPAVTGQAAVVDEAAAAGHVAPAVTRQAADADAAAAPHVALRAEPLSLDALVARVRDPRAGAVVTFQGVTREVPSLEYEAYAEMALEQMRAIVAEAMERHRLCAAAAEHRVGVVPLSEPSVIVAVSAPHRPEAFAGCREIIDRLKQVAPIWKRERDEEGGATWVEGTTPPACT